ncbi:hypothetical protein HK405_011816, partial [Cladochytrium tenue]
MSSPSASSWAASSTRTAAPRRAALPPPQPARPQQQRPQYGDFRRDRYLPRGAGGGGGGRGAGRGLLQHRSGRFDAGDYDRGGGGGGGEGRMRWNGGAQQRPSASQIATTQSGWGRPKTAAVPFDRHEARWEEQRRRPNAGYGSRHYHDGGGRRDNQLEESRTVHRGGRANGVGGSGGLSWGTAPSNAHRDYNHDDDGVDAEEEEYQEREDAAAGAYDSEVEGEDESYDDDDDDHGEYDDYDGGGGGVRAVHRGAGVRLLRSSRQPVTPYETAAIQRQQQRQRRKRDPAGRIFGTETWVREAAAAAVDGDHRNSNGDGDGVVVVHGLRLTNLSMELSEAELAELFGSYRSVRAVRLEPGRGGGGDSSSAAANVLFEDEGEAERAYAWCATLTIDGIPLQVHLYDQEIE